MTCYSVSSSPAINPALQGPAGDSDGGWLENPAATLGQTATTLAAKMDHLSRKIDQAALDNPGSVQSIQDNVELQVVTQKFTQLMSALEHVLKAIGEAQARVNHK